MEKEFYSEQIRIGKRTYFLDINFTEEGIEKFSEAFVRVLLRMNSNKIQENKNTYSVEKNPTRTWASL